LPENTGYLWAAVQENLNNTGVSSLLPHRPYATLSDFDFCAPAENLAKRTASREYYSNANDQSVDCHVPFQ
jgi:hypothetical protein